MVRHRVTEHARQPIRSGVILKLYLIISLLKFLISVLYRTRILLMLPTYPEKNAIKCRSVPETVISPMVKVLKVHLRKRSKFQYFWFTSLTYPKNFSELQACLSVSINVGSCFCFSKQRPQLISQKNHVINPDGEIEDAKHFKVVRQTSIQSDYNPTFPAVSTNAIAEIPPAEKIKA